MELKMQENTCVPKSERAQVDPRRIENGGCALHIQDEKEYRSIAFSKNKKSFHVEFKNDKVVENSFPVKDIY